MSTAVGDLVATLGMNTSPWSSAIAGAKQMLNTFKQDAQAGMSQLKQTMSNLGSHVGLGGVLAGGGMGAAIWKSISEAGEAAKAQKRLQVILEQTGGAADISAGQINEFAERMMKLTNYDDDAVVSASAALAVFKQRIPGDTFQEALKAAMDINTIMGGDLTDTTRKLGMALADPLKGMKLLRSEGVLFTAEQQSQIKQAMKLGDLNKAQGIILEQVGQTFGGAAEKMASPLTMMKNEIGNIAKEFGAMLLPLTKGFASAMVSGLSTIMQALRALRDRFAAVWQTISEAWGSVGSNPLVKGMVAALPVIAIATAAVAGLLPWLVNIGVVLSAAFTVATGPIGIAFVLIAGVGAAILKVAVHGETMADKLQNVFQWMGESIDAVAMVFRNFTATMVLGYNDILLKALDAAEGMVGPFKNAVQVFIGAWAGAAGAFGAVVDNMQAKLLNFATTARDSAVSIVSGFKAVAQGDWQNAAGAFGLAITNATGVAATAAQNQAASSAAAFGDAFNAAFGAVGANMSAVGGLATGSIRSVIGMENALMMDQIRRNEAGFELRKRQQDVSEKTGEKKKFQFPDLAAAGKAPKDKTKEELPGILEKGSEEAWKRIMAETNRGSDSDKSPQDRTADGIATLAEKTDDANRILGQISDKLEETSL